MSLASGDLTTLAAAKAYMPSPPSDSVLSGLISRISAQIRAYTNRTIFVPTAFVQQFSGSGTGQLVLPEWPLLSLSSLTISGISVALAPQLDAPSPAVPYGYRFQPWNGIPPGIPAVLDLTGFRFYGGAQNVVALYTAGYQVTNEAQTIPAATTFTITPSVPYGSWATDRGVVNATTGVAFASTTSATPSVGQYRPPDPSLSTPRLTYLFNSADASTPVLLSYGFIPADLEQAALDMIAERASYRARVGVRSQSLAGQESIAYDLSGIPAYIATMLMPYTSVLPPAMGALL